MLCIMASILSRHLVKVSKLILNLSRLKLYSWNPKFPSLCNPPRNLSVQYRFCQMPWY